MGNAVAIEQKGKNISGRSNRWRRTGASETTNPITRGYGDSQRNAASAQKHSRAKVAAGQCHEQAKGMPPFKTGATMSGTFVRGIRRPALPRKAPRRFLPKGGLVVRQDRRGRENIFGISRTRKRGDRIKRIGRKRSSLRREKQKAPSHEHGEEQNKACSYGNIHGAILQCHPHRCQAILPAAPQIRTRRGAKGSSLPLLPDTDILPPS